MENPGLFKEPSLLDSLMPSEMSQPAMDNPPTPVLLVKQKAPLWQGKVVIDGEIRQLSSEDFKGRFQILLFYPLDFTFVCPTELIAFSDRIGEFHALNAQVIGVSVDSEYAHLAWSKMPRDQGGLMPMKLPLLADLSKNISRKFGVLYNEEVAVRGLFIIDPNGTIRHATINDLPIGRDVDEVLRVLQAIQFTDKHGDVCPANWKPGKDTIKPDPKGSLDYFKSSTK